MKKIDLLKIHDNNKLQAVFFIALGFAKKVLYWEKVSQYKNNPSSCEELNHQWFLDDLSLDTETIDSNINKAKRGFMKAIFELELADRYCKKRSNGTYENDEEFLDEFIQFVDESKIDLNQNWFKLANDITRK